jgi:ParB family chromosome partitioning protein
VLRDALANDPDTAFVAVLHALCLNAFYRYASETCLEITAKSASFGTQAPGLNDSASAKSIGDRHARWGAQLPKDAGDLWNVLMTFDGDSRSALFAHCASLSVSAVHEPWNRNPSRVVHAGQLAQAVSLDMVAAGWAPTVDNYLGRVTKARILEAVREAKGEASAQLIDHLKKPDMAKEAERLLAGSGWLPEPLRMPTAGAPATEAATVEAENLPAFLDEDKSAAAGNPSEPLTVAAE